MLCMDWFFFINLTGFHMKRVLKYAFVYDGVWSFRVIWISFFRSDPVRLYTWKEFWNMQLFMMEFYYSEVTLCGWQDVRIQLLPRFVLSCWKTVHPAWFVSSELKCWQWTWVCLLLEVQMRARSCTMCFFDKNWHVLFLTGSWQWQNLKISSSLKNEKQQNKYTFIMRSWTPWA